MGPWLSMVLVFAQNLSFIDCCPITIYWFCTLFWRCATFFMGPRLLILLVFSQNLRWPWQQGGGLWQWKYEEVDNGAKKTKRRVITTKRRVPIWFFWFVKTWQLGNDEQCWWCEGKIKTMMDDIKGFISKDFVCDIYLILPPDVGLMIA